MYTGVLGDEVDDGGRVLEAPESCLFLTADEEDGAGSAVDAVVVFRVR